MKLLKMRVVFLLCIVHSIQGMDEEIPLHNRNTYSHYKSTSNSGVNLSDIYYQQGNNLSFIHCIAILPQEIFTNILSKSLSNTERQSPANRTKPLLLDHDLVLKFFLRAQKMCPLTIGNKTFEYTDLIVLTKEQQDELFTIGNPNPCYTFLTGFDNKLIETQGCCCTKALYCLPKYCCGAIMPSIDSLEKQPEHIRKNLEINTTDYGPSCSCIACCWITALISYGLISIPNACAISCCQTTLPSWLWWIGFGTMNTCGFRFNKECHNGCKTVRSPISKKVFS